MKQHCGGSNARRIDRAKVSHVGAPGKKKQNRRGFDEGAAAYGGGVVAAVLFEDILSLSWRGTFQPGRRIQFGVRIRCVFMTCVWLWLVTEAHLFV